MPPNMARRDGNLMVAEISAAARRPVSRVLSLAGMAIHLGRPLPDASRDLPGRRRENPLGDCSPCRPYVVLLPVGFAVPLPLPGARCALTAPFHPCRPRRSEIGGSGGLLSVALSLGSPPPGVTRHRVSVEPGLSSPGRRRPRAAIRPSGRARGRPRRGRRQHVSKLWHRRGQGRKPPARLAVGASVEAGRSEVALERGERLRRGQVEDPRHGDAVAEPAELALHVGDG